MLSAVTDWVVQSDSRYPYMSVPTKIRIAICFYFITFWVLMLWAYYTGVASRDGLYENHEMLEFFTSAIPGGFLAGLGGTIVGYGMAGLMVRFFQRHPRWLPALLKGSDNNEEDDVGIEDDDLEKGDEKMNGESEDIGISEKEVILSFGEGTLTLGHDLSRWLLTAKKTGEAGV
ncbi:MAG: hypothetical protein LQ338_005320 [Usnochroma carphineum]|nr:MAG: hypothetical protein LQ338_005320 [Usnochroma carphineum]